MGNGFVQTGIENYKVLQKDLEQLRKAPETVLKRTVSDVRTRVPSWVAAEVTKVYGIKKAEVLPVKSGKAKKAVGDIKVKGEKVSALQVVYRGRLLTPVHFGMKPTTPNPGGAQTLKATIIKGQRQTIGKTKKLTKKQRQNIGRNFRGQGTRNSPRSPWMLQQTGNKKEGGVNHIPFQRTKQPGKMDHVFRTVSLPQMVSSERTHEAITKAINEGLEKRLEQHMKLLTK